MSGTGIMTIGHSTRTADEFLALLRAHRITGVADVRTVPAPAGIRIFRATR